MRASNRDPKFHVKIVFKGTTTTSTQTEKRSLIEGNIVWKESYTLYVKHETFLSIHLMWRFSAGDITDSIVTLEIFRTNWVLTRSLGSFEKNVADLVQLQNNSGLSCIYLDILQDIDQIYEYRIMHI